ncbi:MAG: tetratricopeptide repeat protein [Alphaproteobacteria bacterium]|nr:tetratricopeptide repeat protein [Alphaproteobacteria bacterium]
MMTKKTSAITRATGRLLFSTLSMLAASGCSPKENEESKEQNEETPQTEVVVQDSISTDDPYGNIALFEASRSKIKFALAFCENYFPYVYNDNGGKGTWTTGHGLTILYNADGTYKRVTKNTPVPTLEQSDVYKGRYLTIEVLPDIKKHITVSMDENTLIAACVLRYCIGGSNFKTSEFVKQLNAGKTGAELAQTLTGWRNPDGVPKRCYFFAALMAGKIQYSDLLDLRAEGCYNLKWKDIFVYDAKGNLKKDKSDFCEWDFSKVRANLEKAKNEKSTVLWLHAGKNGKKVVQAQLTKDIVPDYIWQEVSNGMDITIEMPGDTISLSDAKALLYNDSSYIAYQKNNYEQALESATVALQFAESNKQRSAAYYNLGITYFTMGNYSRAVENLKKAVSLAETDAQRKATQKALADAEQAKKNQNHKTTRNVALSVLGLAALGYATKKYYLNRQRQR